LSVTADTEVSPEQIKDAKGLLIRVRTINPRNLKDDEEEVPIEELESTNSRTVYPDPEKYVRPVVLKKPKNQMDTIRISSKVVSMPRSNAL